MLLVKSVNSRKKNIDETVGVIKKLEKSWKKTKSANIFNYFYSMKLFYLEMVGQYDDAIPFIKEILSEKYEGEKLNAKRIDKSQLIYSLQYAYLKTI